MDRPVVECDKFTDNQIKFLWVICDRFFPVCVSDGKEGDDVPNGEHPGVESQHVVQRALERDVVEYLVAELIGICLGFEHKVLNFPCYAQYFLKEIAGKCH